MTALDLDHEPPTGSVVALDWGGPHQEVWVSNRSNIGNWYTSDAVIIGHPHWGVVVDRARLRRATLTLLVAADDGAYRSGFQAGLDAAVQAVEELR